MTDRADVERLLYRSKEGFHPRHWGPQAWHTLHVLAANWCPERAREFRDMVRLLGTLLPCARCRGEFPYSLQVAKQRVRRAGRRPFGSRRGAVRLVYELHRIVNARVDRARRRRRSSRGPHERPSFADVERRYAELRRIS